MLDDYVRNYVKEIYENLGQKRKKGKK